MNILFLFLIVVVVVASQQSPVVRVEHGLLSGSWEVSENGRTYASFRGIPYARPPVGKYRFREPQKLKPWTGTWDASRYLSSCLQYDPYADDVVGEENCLFVNIFTPQLNSGTPLPVLIFIHGGAFMYGGGNLYSPKNLMDRDMVVVTLNYRLGPLGFLSTEDAVIPGNGGLKDQAMALHWIKQNIAMFGGNPDSITLSGNSAGAASVHYHFLSPLSEGTFARGIALSGSAFASWTFQRRALQKAKTLASMVGCPTTSSREIAECLRYRPAEVIARAQVDMLEWKDRMFTKFTPTAEPVGTKDAFLTEYPYHRSQTGHMMKVPLMATVTSEEGLYPAAAYQRDSSYLRELESQWNALASHIFEYNDTLPLAQRKEVAQKIKEKYLGGRPVSQETFGPLVQALGDRLFTADVGKLAQMHAAKSGQPVFVYKYAFRGKKSFANVMSLNQNNYGACHADDTIHLFQCPKLHSTAPEDKKMTDLLLDIVYTYSTQGVPKVSNVEWNPVTPGSPAVDYLEISSATDLKMKSDPDFGQKSFWSSLGFQEWEKYSSITKDEL